MSDPVNLIVRAVVGDEERAAVRKALARLETALAAAGAPVTVSCQFEPSTEALQKSAAPCVIIASLLPEMAHHGDPWPQVEQRLRRDFQQLTSIDGAVVFISTVFRHVPGDDGADPSRLVRIRRLNLLAAELSRETGLFVIDIDRTLAAIGARKLDTDYRLGGEHAADAAAKVIALAIVSAGLDAYVSFDAQDTAKLAISQDRLSLAVTGAAVLDVRPSNVLALGAGRRKQVVATVVDANTESHASWLVQMLFTRQLSFKDAALKLRRSIARRGVRSSSVMLIGAFRQAMRGRPRMGGQP